MKRLIFSSIMLMSLLSLKLEAKKLCPQEDINDIVTGNTEFALDLYAKLREDQESADPDGNLFFSPYSISSALAMTYSGARGKTEKQMADVLHFSLPQLSLHAAFAASGKKIKADPDELLIANALWGQKDYKFLESFLDINRKYYGAGLKEVDFVTETEKARKTINAWVEKNTNKKIKDLLKPDVLNNLTRLVLTNAIYFKSDWELQFDKKDTKDAPFTISQDKKIQIPLMYLKDDFKYYSNKKLQLLELPYKDEYLSMIVLLPQKTNGLSELEKQLNCENLNTWLARLRKQEVIVYLPRFKTTSEFGLAETLADMGMPDAFSRDADFSGMNGKKDLFISAVVHKAFVEVNEEGTEAAAATGVAIGVTSVSKPPPVFRADHPFIFIIKDNCTNSILFMGKISNPASQDKEDN